MIPHFADPDVGGVQGLILPLQSRGWTRKLRFMEIAWNHLFLRRALMATRTTQVVDGAFCAFRRRDLLAVGGWVSWNGEDTEITLRLERVGYNMRFETRTGAFEDVPPNYAALKKQRVRWNRGGFFAHRRHFGAIFSGSVEYGGIAMLFWFLLFIRGGLRSLIYVYAILVTVLLGIPTFYHLLIIVGLLLLPRALVIGYYLVRLRRWGYLPWLPIWPVAGAIKQFFTMEAFGTMLPGSSPEFAE
jgi:cellulose synthase/poly-beta-1,6-N-acetylglucosamine synthase-like glycosyltransferase